MSCCDLDVSEWDAGVECANAVVGEERDRGKFGVADANDIDGPIEAILGCPNDVEPTATVGIRTEPAHDEAYTTITKAQWAFPAILTAYDAVAQSPQATSRPGSRLSCREVYLAEPDDINDNELICDIAFPLG